MPRLSAVRARHAALVGIIYHTCLPLFTLNSPSLHSKYGVRCQCQCQLMCCLCTLPAPLYIGHIYVIIYTTYI